MSGHSLSSEDNAILAPSYGLIYRGLAPDAQKQRIIEILGPLLSIDQSQVELALSSPLLRLTHNPDRERIRKYQMSLANLGCIATVDHFWQYRDWCLSDELEHSYEVDAEHAPEQAFSLIRFQPGPGYARLQQALSDCQCKTHILNHTDILLQADGHHGSELRNNITNVKQKLQDVPECQVALGLFPQDGDHLTELLDCLNERLASSSFTDSDKTSDDIFQNEACLAGQAWLEWTKLGRQFHDGLNQQQASYCDAHWPSLLVHQQSSRHPPERILKAWTQAREKRAAALEGLRMHCERLDQLPSLPTMIIRIHQKANDPESSGKEISDLVEQDPSLSARILALVNSSWFGLKARVESIEHALVVIGREELAHLALMISSEKVFHGLKSQAAQNLWRHSSQVGEIARELGRRCHHQHVSNLFTAGLLHDVGKILLFSFEGARMEAIQKRAEQLGIPDYEVEREIWGYDHARLGALMLKRWGLPDTLCTVVEQHHGPLPDASGIELDGALIALADHIAHLEEASQNYGDKARLRASQLECLRPHFGELTPESVDLLRMDLHDSLRGPAHEN